jgi:hypothetical protein
MSNIVIDIAAEFTGNKSFKQAESATDKLGKNVKKLAGALGLAFGGQQILAYGKAAVKAAAADEKAQKQLALALKNVGLGRDAASSEEYIQRLQSEFGILDDKLRPAYQTLAVATGNTAEAQRLLNLSLDIAASTGKDLGSVTSALSRAYLGNNTALSKLGVGISKADLKAGKFEDIISDLEVTFKGAATQAANTFQGSIDKLGVAAANASEIIGTGLIDALKGLGDQDSVDNLASAMQNTAIYIADVIRGIGVLTEKLSSLPGVSGLNIGMIPILGTYLEMLRAAGQASLAGQSGINAQGLADLARLQAAYVVKTLGAKKKLTAEELKALKAARLKLALDKANLALLKGEEVFDMDKIQIAAALTNQAEQLGKATTSAQRLQIANDVARLNVKQSILALEDAIAAKDELAITKATEKLNADLKVLSALTGQSAKLTDIKSILDSLKPKDLINQANLDAALAKIAEMIRLLAQANLAATTRPARSGDLGSGIPEGDYIAPVSMTDALAASTDALLELSDAVQERADAFAMLLDLDTEAKIQALAESSLAVKTGADLFNIEDVARKSLLAGLSGGAGVSGAVSGSRYAAQAAAQYNLTVNTGIGDPEAIARAIEDAIRQSYQRGTSATGLLAV